MSGGAGPLAADEIVMCKHSVLGPMIQLGNMPGRSLLKVIVENRSQHPRPNAGIGGRRRKAIGQVKVCD
jgi:hypothetical protein